MTTYEKLDIIADSYNPILFIIALFIIIYDFKNKGKVYAFYETSLLFVLVALVYIFQTIDLKLNIWVSFGFDYSTHTAFSVAIIFFMLFKNTKTITLISISFIAYLLLMLYQQYHTVADILTTILAISPLMFISSYYVHQQLEKQSNEHI